MSNGNQQAFIRLGKGTWFPALCIDHTNHLSSGYDWNTQCRLDSIRAFEIKRLFCDISDTNRFSGCRDAQSNTVRRRQLSGKAFHRGAAVGWMWLESVGTAVEQKDPKIIWVKQISNCVGDLLDQVVNVERTGRRERCGMQNSKFLQLPLQGRFIFFFFRNVQQDPLPI